MNNIFLNSTTLGVVISLLAYYLGVFLKNKTKKAFVNPLLISIVLVIVFLLVFDIAMMCCYKFYTLEIFFE